VLGIRELDRQDAAMNAGSDSGRDGFVEIAGMRFHYREWGNPTAPPVVLLHGALLLGRAYDCIAEELSATYRVLAVDQRGHGETDRATDYSWPRWIEDVNGFVDAIGLSRFDLVGHSMGADIASRFAGTHPDRVAHLVLLEGGFGPINSTGFDDWIAGIFRAYPENGFDAPSGWVDAVLAAFPRADRHVIEAATYRLVVDEHGRFHMPRLTDPAALDRTDPSEEEELALRRMVACPVLVAKAEHSELFIGDGYRHVASMFPHGEAAVVLGAGHNLHNERTDATVALIKEFLARS
jgi:pimeloyl-ACP methyl ester carboxylesterase